MDKKEIIYAFIDSQNLNLAIKHDIPDKDIFDTNGKLTRNKGSIYKGWTLDFKKFFFLLKKKFMIERAFLFIGYKPDNQRLYTFLQEVGYILVFKPTLPAKEDGKVKGNVDAELVLQAMIELPKYDKAIIISGDGDFHCLIKYLLSKNKLSKLMLPNKKRFSSLLRKFSDYHVYVNLFEKRLKKEDRHLPGT